MEHRLEDQVVVVDMLHQLVQEIHLLLVHHKVIMVEVVHLLDQAAVAVAVVLVLLDQITVVIRVELVELV